MEDERNMEETLKDVKGKLKEYGILQENERNERTMKGNGEKMKEHSK